MAAALSLRRSVLVTGNKKFIHQKFSLPATSGFPSVSSRSFSQWSRYDEYDGRHRHNIYESDRDSSPSGSHPVYNFGNIWKHAGKDGLKINLDLMGLGKEDVKVYYKKYTRLMVEEISTEIPRSLYQTELKENQYKTDEISLEMKNGMLSIFLPNDMNEEEIKKKEDNVKNLLSNGHDTIALIANHGGAPGDNEHVVESGNANSVENSDLVSLDSTTSSLFSGDYNELYPRRLKGDHWMAENADGLFLSNNLPGLRKEDVEVTMEMEHKMLIIKEKKRIRGNEEENNDVSEDEDEDEDEDESEKRVPYTRCFKLPKENSYDGNQVTAEMKNGLLRVFIPKLNLEKIAVEVKGE